MNKETKHTEKDAEDMAWTWIDGQIRSFSLREVMIYTIPDDERLIRSGELYHDVDSCLAGTLQQHKELAKKYSDSVKKLKRHIRNREITKVNQKNPKNT